MFEIMLKGNWRKQKAHLYMFTLTGKSTHLSSPNNKAYIYLWMSKRTILLKRNMSIYLGCMYSSYRLIYPLRQNWDYAIHYQFHDSVASLKWEHMQGFMVILDFNSDPEGKNRIVGIRNTLHSSYKNYCVQLGVFPPKPKDLDVHDVIISAPLVDVRIICLRS